MEREEENKLVDRYQSELKTRIKFIVLITSKKANCKNNSKSSLNRRDLFITLVASGADISYADFRNEFDSKTQGF